VILEQLKSRTTAAHRSIEARLRIARPRPSLHDYANYLAAMYGFCAPLEASFRQLPSDWLEALRIEERCRAHLLVTDLSTLKVRLGRALVPSHCEHLPAGCNVARTLGTLWVLEGSTLGARYLLRHLRALGIADCSSYLGSYGEELGRMWQELRTQLLRFVAEEPDRAAEVVDSALETFGCLDAWFVRCGAAEVSRVA